MICSRIVFEAAGKAALKQCDIPPLKPGEVLLENEFTVVSAGTERANLVRLPNTGTTEKGFPFYPGYCGAGRVAAIGENITGWNIGDRAVVQWGGHSSHTIKQARDIVKIEDDSIDLMDASFAHIASFAFLGVRRLRIELGEAAMIVGQGILGVFALQFAGLSGAIPVLASDFDPARRALAERLGATRVFSPDEGRIVEKVKEASGGDGPNAIVEVTGSATALRQALEYVAFGGRISLLGCTRVSDTPIDFYKYVHRRGISLVGAHTMTRPKQESAPGRWTEQDDYRTYLKLLAAGKLQVRPLISQVASPAEAPQVYAMLAENRNPPLGIVFDWRKLR
ncbi:MAG: zinc-binding alcohol dehydrogenase [Lentisphaerae bacterium]|nr:zinc-binding alcohol dehydrogenase [Lentisphaerota bacterium]